jgi:CheY-like chemotaxis protein
MSAQEMIETDVKRVRVLVVDDVAINRKVAERLLIRIYGEDKVDITTSNDGKDAVDVFSSRNGEFDVILMDLMMPVLDGFGALEQIRRMDSDIPVIALTAGAGDLLDRADQQFSQVLTKPFTFGGLVEALSSVSVYDAEDVSMQPFLKASYD